MMPDTAKLATIKSNIATGQKSAVQLLPWLRRGVQFTFILFLGLWSFYGIFRCPFIVPYVSCQNCPVITCHGRLFTLFGGFWVLLPVSALLFGRAFCGWACPGGLVSQLSGKIAPLKLHGRNFFRKVLPNLKYLILLLALYVWLIWGQPRVAIPIRIGDFFSSIYLTFEHADLIWLIRTGVVIFFLIAGLLISNIWCKFICPTGGLLEGIRSISLFRVYKDQSCNDCDNCLDICEMGTRPAESNCTNCCDCLSDCPQDAIKIGSKRNKS